MLTRERIAGIREALQHIDLRSRLGMPSGDEIVALLDRIDELEKEVEELRPLASLGAVHLPYLASWHESETH